MLNKVVIALVLLATVILSFAFFGMWGTVGLIGILLIVWSFLHLYDQHCVHYKEFVRYREAAKKKRS